MKRVASIDSMRGIVMIIMALDHVRDMLHTTAITQQPTDLATTTPALFFTRWITHLCAPTFVFLSGTSAFMSMRSQDDIGATRRFLFSRGLVLILLEFTVVNFGLWFDIHFTVSVFDVIATIGFGFIILALLIRLPLKTIAVIGLAIIFLHNLAPLVPGAETSLFKKILMPFFSPAAFPFAGGKLFVIGYPPIPWLGIMLVGFAAGKLFLLEERRQKIIFVKIGVTAILLFIVLRTINIYGDSARWATQKSDFYSFLSFINVTKYPPSLDFTLLFLGIFFLLLALVHNRQNWLTNVATVYGRTPLFYFIVHFYIIHVLVFAMIFLQGFGVHDMVFGFNLGRPQSGSGIPLLAVYLVWIGIVIAMYPLCKIYGRYKMAHKEKEWLRYL